MAQRARYQAAAVLNRALTSPQAAAAESQQTCCLGTLLRQLRQAASTAAAQQQPCSGLHLLPRLQLTQPLRSQALGGRRHLLAPFTSTSSRSYTTRTSTTSGRAWRAWVQQQLSNTHVRGAFRTYAAAAAPAPPAWGVGAGRSSSSWFNNMPAAAAWWDSWTLWVGAQASFIMAALLNSINLVGNKLPVALGLLLVDMVHNSPLLRGSSADALHSGTLPATLPAGGFYAAAGPAGKAAAAAGSNNSRGGLWRSTASTAASVWTELVNGLSAGARLLWLGCIWLPALVTAPVLLGWPRGRELWLALMTLSLEASGPAFIKWGQWAATRHDLFAHDVCEALEKLHTQAPAHSFRYTCHALHKSFDLPPDQLFDWIEEVPIACGSIGQVHRAQLSEKGAALACCDPGEVVAVKVRHPGVSDAIERDFQTMVWVAHVATQLLPSVRSLRLEDTLKQFAAPLHEQVDLSREASNLQRFNTNFRRARGVSFPVPLFPLVSEDVLVESFEDGKHISAYITGHAGSDPYRARLAELGSGTMLQMMLVDNLIHSDLHPGNILVRLEQPHGLVGVAYKAVTALANPEGLPMKALGSALQQLDAQQQQQEQQKAADSSSGVLAEAVEAVSSKQQQVSSSRDDSSKKGSSSRKGVWGLATQLNSAWSSGGPSAVLSVLQSRLRGVAAGWLQPHIVLLDVGMATELSPEDQTNMVGLFRSFAVLDGRNVARWTLRFSGDEQSCHDPQAFIEDMADTFETLKQTIAAQEAARMRWEQQMQLQKQQQQQGSSSSSTTASGLLEMPEQFDSGAEALSTVLELVRLHGVSLPGHIAGCVVTTLILEGWSNKLSNEHSVLHQVQSMFSPALLPWRARIATVVDTVMDSNTAALAMT